MSAAAKIIPASDRAVGLGHNHPPAEDARERPIDPRLVAIAWKAAQAIGAALDEFPEAIAAKRQRLRPRLIRKLWHYALRAHCAPDPKVAEDLEAVRAEIEEREAELEDEGADEEAMRRDPALADLKARRNILLAEGRGRNWMLGRISGVGRDQVEDDQAEVDRWIARSPLIAEAMDEIRDMLEPLPGLHDKAANGDLIEACAIEARRDRLANELREVEDALKRARGAKDKAALKARAAALLEEAEREDLGPLPGARAVKRKPPAPPPKRWSKTERAREMLARGDTIFEVAAELDRAGTPMTISQLSSLYLAMRDEGALQKAAR